MDPETAWLKRRCGLLPLSTSFGAKKRRLNSCQEKIQWLKPVAAQCKELLGAGRALKSGQGASRQFGNLIKHEIPSNHCRSMAKASRSSIQGDHGRGEGFEIGTGGHPSVLKSHKTRQGASRKPIKPLPQHG